MRSFREQSTSRSSCRIIYQHPKARKEGKEGDEVPVLGIEDERAVDEQKTTVDHRKFIQHLTLPQQCLNNLMHKRRRYQKGRDEII